MALMDMPFPWWSEMILLGKLWSKVFFSLFVGAFVGYTVQGLGGERWLRIVWRPLLGAAKLPGTASLVLSISLADRLASLSTLADLYRQGQYRRGHVLALAMLTSFLSSWNFTIFSLTPLLVSSFGWRPGMISLSAYLAVHASISIFAVLISRFSQAKGQGRIRQGEIPEAELQFPSQEPISMAKRKPAKEVFALAVHRSVSSVLKTARIFIPASILGVWLVGQEFFLRILEYLGPVMAIAGLPPSTLVVLTAGTVSMMAGVGVMGSMIAAGQVAGLQIPTIFLLVLLVHHVYDAFVQTLALHISIFGLRLGAYIVWVTLVVRIVMFALGIVTLCLFIYV